MKPTFIDISFRSHSQDSDLICKDGELEPSFFSVGLKVTDLPAPDIDFALVRESLPGWNINPDQFPMKTLPASTPSMEYWTSVAAQLLVQFNSEAQNQNLFVAPFYVKAAWKTFDNLYLSPTEPVLLTSNSAVPLVAAEGDVNSSELIFKVTAAVCSLYFKMKAPEILRDWIPFIESLVILVSPPIQSYNTFQAFLPFKHITSDNFCECLDLDSGAIIQRRICTETLSLAWKANVSEKETNSDTKFYPFASIPLSEVDIKNEWSPSSPFLYRLNPVFELGSSNSSPEVVTLLPITTRPIKLSSAAKLKTLVRAWLRGNFNPANISFSVYASRDMLNWWCIAQRKGGAVLAFPKTPCRFFRVVVSGHLHDGENLQGICFSLL